MQYQTLDSIVRSVLLKKGYTLHYYIEYLSYGASGLRKLNIHSLKNISPVKLPVNSYRACTLPTDYVDYVRVGFAVGELVRPLIYDPSLNRLNNVDSTGAKIPYTSTLPDGMVIDQSNINIYGSVPFLSGVSFGHDLSRDDWKFNIFKERNEIQLSVDFPYQYIILDYITDGLNITAATQVDPLAQEAIEKYILWQAALHRRSAGEGEKQAAEDLFNREHRLLRAAKNPMTAADYIAAVRSGYSPLPKN